LQFLYFELSSWLIVFFCWKFHYSLFNFHIIFGVYVFIMLLKPNPGFDLHHVSGHKLGPMTKVTGVNHIFYCAWSKNDIILIKKSNEAKIQLLSFLFLLVFLCFEFFLDFFSASSLSIWFYFVFISDKVLIHLIFFYPFPIWLIVFFENFIIHCLISFNFHIIFDVYVFIMLLKLNPGFDLHHVSGHKLGPMTRVTGVNHVFFIVHEVKMILFW